MLENESFGKHVKLFRDLLNEQNDLSYLTTTADDSRLGEIRFKLLVRVDKMGELVRLVPLVNGRDFYIKIEEIEGEKLPKPPPEGFRMVSIIIHC